MTLTIELPYELEEALSSEAVQRGISLSEYALQLLSSRKEKIVMPQTGAELVDYWYEMGVIGTRSDIENASAYARKLRKEAETRNVAYLS